MDITTTTLAGAIGTLKELGAASLAFIVRDKKDRPLAAVIVVRGRDEAGEIVAAHDSISSAWSDGHPACGIIEWRYITDEMPDEDTMILIASKESGQPSEGYVLDGRWCYANSGLDIPVPYAWAPLPEIPPQKKGGA